jgi:FkbM family methyltransferase
MSRLTITARRWLNRLGYDLVREPFGYRFLHALREHGIDEVIDVGANVGQFGAALRSHGFGGRIVSAEPLAAAFERLAARAATDDAWIVERTAVSNAAGTLTMNVSANSVSSSPLPILERHTTAAPRSQYVGSEEVPATTVDELVARHALAPERTLLKLDVQGYEMSVLEGAGKTLPHLAAVRTEMSLVPLYDGQVLMPELVTFLGDHGFDLWQVERGFTEPDTRRTLQLDGIFFRREDAR